MMIINPWRRIREMEEQNKALNDALCDEMRLSDIAITALEDIQGMATPRANGTVQKMAKRADDAIKEIYGDH